MKLLPTIPPNCPFFEQFPPEPAYPKGGWTWNYPGMPRMVLYAEYPGPERRVMADVARCAWLREALRWALCPVNDCKNFDDIARWKTEAAQAADAWEDWGMARTETALHPPIPTFDKHFSQYADGHWFFSLLPHSAGHIRIYDAHEHRYLVACAARCAWLDHARESTEALKQVRHVNLINEERDCLANAEAWKKWGDE